MTEPSVQPGDVIQLLPATARATRRLWADQRILVKDCCFLGCILIASFILYVGQLGFYSDDWDFFAIIDGATDQSLPGRFQEYYATPQRQSRPALVLYLVALYQLFGLSPLGYHIVN